jgi:hypothetical protein
MRLNNTYSTHIASKYVLQRELGLKFPLGFRDRLHHKIYSSLQPAGSWDHSLSSSSKSGSHIHGGVFNLEYSPDGYAIITHFMHVDHVNNYEAWYSNDIYSNTGLS